MDVINSVVLFTPIFHFPPLLSLIPLCLSTYVQLPGSGLQGDTETTQGAHLHSLHFIPGHTDCLGTSPVESGLVQVSRALDALRRPQIFYERPHQSH